MEFEIKAGPQGHYYFPKKIREAFGTKIILLPNAAAGAIYSKDTDLTSVIESLRVVIQDLELRAKKAKRNGS